MKLASTLSATLLGLALSTSTAKATQETQHVVICAYKKAFNYRTEPGYSSNGPAIIGIFPTGSTSSIVITTEPGRTSTDAILREGKVVGVTVSKDYFEWIERYFETTKPIVADTIVNGNFVAFHLSPAGPSDPCP